MRLLLLSAIQREVLVVEEDDPEALIRRTIPRPQGMVDLPGGVGMIVCPVGIIGAEVSLWWHHELGEVFGGDALIVGIGPDDGLTGVPEGSWARTRRSVEFIGIADAALPRLRELVGGAMGGSSADERQGVLSLEPRNDLR